jgi:polar amino acid transport system substrate-binding protein
MLQVLEMECTAPSLGKGASSPEPKALEHAPRILVAEDNAIAGKVITALLEKLGYAASLITDGKQALARIRMEDYAMALVDLHMPEMDGIALVSAYRADEKPGDRLPIVALTASAEEDVKARCLRAGMDDFLAKPVTQQELSAMVERYVGARRDP